MHILTRSPLTRPTPCLHPHPYSFFSHYCRFMNPFTRAQILRYSFIPTLNNFILEDLADMMDLPRIRRRRHADRRSLKKNLSTTNRPFFSRVALEWGKNPSFIYRLFFGFFGGERNPASSLPLRNVELRKFTFGEFIAGAHKFLHKGMHELDHEFGGGKVWRRKVANSGKQRERRSGLITRRKS